MTNLSDNYDYYKDQELILDDFDYQYDDDAQDIFDEHQDGGNPEVRGLDESYTFKVGQYSTRFPITNAEGSAAWTGTIESIDVSRFTGVDSGTPTQGKIKCVITRSSTSNVSAIKIRVGSDSSNYGEWSPTLPSVTVPVTLDDNLSGLTIVGTPDWTNVDFIEILTTNSGDAHIELSGLRLTHATRVTKGIWEEANAQMTTANADSIFYLAKRQNELTFLHPDGADATSEIINEFADKEMDNNFTLISKFRWRRDGASGREIGVAFHISDTTEASQDCYLAYIDESDNQVNFDKFVGGSQTNIDSKAFTPSTNTNYWLKVENNNGTFTISVSTDGQAYTTYIKIADSTYTTGTVGTYSAGNPVAEFYEFYCFNLPYVTFDNWSFHARDMITVTDVQEDSAPQLDIKTMNLTAVDKDIFIQKNWKSKFINVTGNLNTTNVTDLTETIDDFKEHVGREEKSLRVGKDTSDKGIFKERSYTATAVNLDAALKREHWHKTFMPFNITFQASDGIAQDANSISLPQFDWDEYTFTKSYIFQGSANPLPIFTFALTDATPASGTLDSVILSNITTGRSVELTSSTAFSDGDSVIFNFPNKEITVNTVVQDYSGSLSDDFFVPGLNRVSYSITRASDIDQENPAPTGASFKASPLGGYGDEDRAQSFQPDTTTTFPRFDIFMKNNNLDSAVRLRIETDNAGSPSGTIATAGAQVDVDPADWDDGFAFRTFELGTAASLTSGTDYWMVLQAEGGNIGIGPVKNVQVKGSADNSYADGQDKYLHDGTWTVENANYDWSFKAYKTGPTGISGTLDISYVPRYV